MFAVVVRNEVQSHHATRAEADEARELAQRRLDAENANEGGVVRRSRKGPK
jgi:hypothetical protein